MATDDASLIEEVRGLTDYDSDILSDSELQALVDLGKEELRAELGNPQVSYYNNGRIHATRALFWFVCIAAKVKVGEIAGVNIEVESFRSWNPAEGHYGFWFRNFDKRLSAAENVEYGGTAHVQISRDNRSYGE